MKEKSNTKEIILQVDPRGVIIDGGNDVVNRQKNYARKLSTIKSGCFLRMVVISASKSYRNISDYKSNFDLYTVSSSTFNILFFSYKAIRLCKNKNLRIRLIVAGDPWEGLICSMIIRFFLNKNSPIQVHIHADIGNPVWVNLNWKNKIRASFARLFLKNIESIRTVGITQTKYLLKEFKLEKTKITVIPVPINTQLLTVLPSKVRPASVAFIGRIHKDRGIDRFVKLLKILNLNRKGIKLVIVGDGFDKDKFLKEIDSLFSKNGYKYLGQITEKELRKVWADIGILVSMAPAESYGRVMREALVAGVPVWATKSSGVEDLISRAGKDAVKILDLKKNSHDLNQDLDQLLRSKVPLSFRKQFIKDNSTYAQLLAKSWVDLINKQKK